MANRWTGTIATQTVVFRGTSQVGVLSANQNFPTFHTVSGAGYFLTVTGGVSGNFSCVVNGTVSGHTVHLAGVTAVTAAGVFALYPIGYSSNGSVVAVPLATALGDALTYTSLVAPSNVQFIANTGTAGISASCTVRAAVYGGY